jgi:hypothetical protein
MMSSGLLLAQLQGLNPLNPAAPIGTTGGLLLKDVLLIIGTGLVLAALLLIWARFYVRNRAGRRHQQHHHRRPSSASAAASADIESDFEPNGRRRHRRRRRRRDHRARNPTLAETGGLPPAKSEELPPQVS